MEVLAYRVNAWNVHRFVRHDDFDVHLLREWRLLDEPGSNYRKCIQPARTDRY